MPSTAVPVTPVPQARNLSVDAPAIRRRRREMLASSLLTPLRFLDLAATPTAPRRRVRARRMATRALFTSDNEDDDDRTPTRSPPFVDDRIDGSPPFLIGLSPSFRWGSVVRSRALLPAADVSPPDSPYTTPRRANAAFNAFPQHLASPRPTVLGGTP